MTEKVSWRVEVKVSADARKATIIMSTPTEGVEPSVEEVMQALQGAGVVAGIDHDAIAQAILDAKWEQPVIVATSVLPVQGKDSSVRYLFGADASKQPVEREDGRVDYKNRDLLVNVREGDALAERVPPVPGKDGIDVTGAPIPARPTRILPLPAGSNVAVSSDGERLVATASGQPVVSSNGMLHVYPVYEIQGDVGMETGNIRFVGSCVVHGAVLAGFEIEAEGNIEVKGFVAGDRVAAGGNIVVAKGIQGRGRGRVEAQGSVTAMFMENAVVVSGHEIRVRDAIMHSTVSAKKKVIVRGGKGVIVGGTVCAGEEVIARIVGSSLATPTEIEVGMDPDLRDKKAEVHRLLQEKQSELLRIDQAIRLLKAKMESAHGIDADKKAILRKLIAHRTALQQEIADLVSAKEAVEEQIRKNKKGRVTCRVVYPGTRFVVGSSNLQVTDEWYDVVVFMGEDGKVAISGK